MMFQAPSGKALSTCALPGALLSLTCLLAAAPASAQTYSANTMWGVAASGNGTSGSGSPMDSSVANHLSMSATSNYVDAARAGVILNPNLSSSVTIQSIGSQTVVSNTVTGNNNTTSISGTQSSSNTGAVTNTATSNY